MSSSSPRNRSGGTKIFVYGVHSSCPKNVLEDEFARHGEVTDIFITGKGYAFVTMSEEADAKAAVKELNGVTIDGQEVKVELAHGRGSRNRGGGGGGGRGGGYRDRGYGGGGYRNGGGYRQGSIIHC